MLQTVIVNDGYNSPTWEQHPKLDSVVYVDKHKQPRYGKMPFLQRERDQRYERDERRERERRDREARAGEIGRGRELLWVSCFAPGRS